MSLAHFIALENRRRRNALAEEYLRAASIAPRPTMTTSCDKTESVVAHWYVSVVQLVINASDKPTVNGSIHLCSSDDVFIQASADIRELIDCGNFEINGNLSYRSEMSDGNQPTERTIISVDEQPETCLIMENEGKSVPTTDIHYATLSR